MELGFVAAHIDLERLDDIRTGHLVKSSSQGVQFEFT